MATSSLPITKNVWLYLDKEEELILYLCHSTFNCYFVTTEKYITDRGRKAQNDKILAEHGIVIDASYDSGIHLILNMPGKITAAQRAYILKKTTPEQRHLMWLKDYSEIHRNVSPENAKICDYIKNVNLSTMSLGLLSLHGVQGLPEGARYERLKKEFVHKNINSHNLKEHLNYSLLSTK